MTREGFAGDHADGGADARVHVRVPEHPAEVAQRAERAAAKRAGLARRLSGSDVSARRSVVRRAAWFPGLGANHLRVTARSPAENDRVIEALSIVAQPAG